MSVSPRRISSLPRVHRRSLQRKRNAAANWRPELLEAREVMTTSPGGVGLAELTAWLNPSSFGPANPAGVTSPAIWADASGHGNHATAASLSSSPTLNTGTPMNGNSVVNFNGVQSLMLPTANALGILNSDFEFFVVGRTSNGGIQFLTGGPTENYEIHLNGASGVRFIPEGPFSNDRSSDQGINGQYTDGSSRIFSARVDNAIDPTGPDGAPGGVVRTDGVDSSDITFENAASVNDGNIFLGRRDNGSFFYVGDMAEVLVFGSALNSAQRQMVENYLSSKYDTVLASGDIYSGDTVGNGDYDADVFGVGRVDAGNLLATAASGGLGFTVLNGTLDADGEYLTAGHSVGSQGRIPYTAGNGERLARAWFLDKTGTLDARLTFDLSDAGLPAPSANQVYRLLFSATQAGPFADAGLAASIAGDQVSFDVGNAQLADGYYTLAIQSAVDDTLPVSDGQTIAAPGVLANDAGHPNATAGAGSYTSEVQADAPVGYWRLAEPDGAATAINSGSAGVTLDGTYNAASGNADSVPGLIVGDANTAVEFDGTQDPTGDFITGSGLNSVPGGNPFANDWTIEAWFTHDQMRQWEGIFSNTVAGVNGPLMTFIDNTNLLGINGAGTVADNVSIDLGPAHFGKKVYAVITKQGGNGPGQSLITVYAWVDGVPLAPVTGTTTWALAPSDSFYIGRHWFGGNQNHDGVLDEVAIYNKALSSADVERHFQANNYSQATVDLTAAQGSALVGGTVTVATAGGNTVIVNDDGSFTFQGGAAYDALAAGQLGADSFTYTLTTATGATDTATVNLNLTGVNDAPQLTSINITNPATEGSTATLSGTLTDPDLTDSHTLIVDWGDGVIESLAIGAGLTNFSFNHTYADDNPTATASDNYTVRARLLDAGSFSVISAISYWNFDEASSGTATAVDQSDSNNGTFQGTATRGTGLVGTVGAAQFNQAGADAVNVGPGTANNFSVTAGITVEALILPDAALGANQYEEIFRKEDGGNRILFSFQEFGTILSLGLNTGGYSELDMPLNGTNNGAVPVFFSGVHPGAIVLKDGATHHVVGTYDVASGLKAIYVDGILAHSQLFAPGTAIVSGGAANAFIGSLGGVGEPFAGKIDEVSVFGSALSASQIAARARNVQAGVNPYGFDDAAPLTVTVQNSVPSVQSLAPAAATEGTLYTLTGTFIDLGRLNDTYTITINWGDGSPVETFPNAAVTLINAGTGLLQFVATHTYSDDGAANNATINFGVTDDDTGNGSSSVVVAIANVAPVMDPIAGPTEGVPNQPLVYTFSATDVSPEDEAAGFTFRIDWDGNGTIDETIAAVPGQTSVTVPHTYTTLGDKQIRATATDKDSGTSAVETLDVSITPFMEVNGVLIGGGTSSSDRILIQQGKGGLVVRMNNVFYGPFNDTWERAIIYAGAGNDIVQMHANAGLILECYGGTGFDTLTGAQFDDTLFGEAGDDNLQGLGGNDLLDAGDGKDKIDAGTGDDIIFGGAGNDSITAGAGNDTASGGDGNDSIGGVAGDDILRGGAGGDTISGGLGTDLIFGNNGNDTLKGEDGNDMLIGGVGADLLYGGLGDDVLIGGNAGGDAADSLGNRDDDQANNDALTQVLLDWQTDPQTGIDSLIALGDITYDDGNDKIYGNAGIDIFYAMPIEVKDKATNESVI